MTMLLLELRIRRRWERKVIKSHLVDKKIFKTVVITIEKDCSQLFQLSVYGTWKLDQGTPDMAELRKVGKS